MMGWCNHQYILWTEINCIVFIPRKTTGQQITTFNQLDYQM
jgi:hypothetical protein